MRLRTLYFLILLIAVSCNNSRYELTEDSVIVKYQQASKEDVKLIKVRVIDDNIIHIEATPEKDFSPKESLMVQKKKWKIPEWKVEEKGDTVSIITSEVTVNLSLLNGNITFIDPAGNTILKEIPSGGKTFIPNFPDGKKKYEIRQIFESPDDEAFYGLGQHQNRQMNYKGQDVELTQHNLVAVVPFLYSNKNYGILWDNYSITRFGDPRPYRTISGLNLFTKEGEPGGLTATYTDNGKKTVIRTEDEIGYQYLESASPWPDEVTPESPSLKVTWEGSFSSEIPGTHKFKLYASEYVKLFIDGKLILDKWRQNWNPWYNNFTVDMLAGEKHNIKIEWIPNGGYLALEHLDPLTQEEQNQLSLYSEVADQINYYFIKGENADNVISGYRELTGKAPIMPKWAMGFWQSRERYKTQEELLDVVKEFRKRKIPLDNIVLDWRYWEDPKWGSHEFDSSRFPNPDEMIRELHQDLNTHIMISVWPKFYKGIEHFDEMQEKGFLFQRNLEKDRHDWIGFVSTFYDPFNPKARELFWEQINEHLNSKDIDAWWMDATEPDMQSNHSIEERKIKMSPNYLGSGAEYFNAYSLMNSKGIYEGLRSTNPDKRVFILTRSAYAGQQRYASATWSGDVACRWSDLRDQISAGLNFCISGIPYWTHDIGGFSLEKRYEDPQGKDLEEWRELNTRWYQFGTFSPLFRVHGQFPFREIYNIAPDEHPAYKSMLYYDKLRYRLMPYIYTLAGKTYHDDYTIMRALVMDYNSDPNVYEIDDEYMFGTDILVAPVTEFHATSREVYLPEGNGWFDFYTGKFMEGGQLITADAPLSKIPLFIKEGAILPFGPEIKCTNEKTDGSITLYIYTGKDGSFEIYEDEGVNYNYEKGDYCRIPVNYKEETGVLVIGDREGKYAGMAESRTFMIKWIDKNKPAGYSFDSKPDVTIKYDGKSQNVKKTRFFVGEFISK